MKRIGILVVALLAVLVVNAEIPQIRFTVEAPFRDGNRVESVWTKADVCTRFLEVIRNEVALDQSEVRILFDARNLYVTMKGFFDPACERGRPDLSESNAFEFFIRPEGCADHLQVVASEFSELYVARTGAQIRDHGVTQTVERGKGFWITDLTIPLATIGLSAAPTDDLRAKVGLFRHNINAHERQKLLAKPRRSATSFTPNAYNFGVPDTWADMVLTRREDAARRVSGPDMGHQVNLFPNSDFDIPGRGWSPCGKTICQETMAMSGEWIYRASGKDYRVLRTEIRWMKPSTRYTLVVKARSFGSGSGLRVVETVRSKSGKFHEGVYPAMLVPIGLEMHEYYIPFTSDAEDPWTLDFYKVDDKADDTGIDFAAIRIYEGEISSFEIRRIGYPGRMAPVKCTEIPVPPGAYGRFPKPLRALVLTTSKYMLREPAQIFAGTGAEVDFLLTQGKDQDVYLTDGDPAAISAALKAGEYDLYMVPKDGAEKIGKELVGFILANVKKGAGLYFEANSKPLHFEEIAKGGTFGKGRVHLAALAAGGHAYLPAANLSEYGPSFLPRARVFDPQVAADAYRTAFGESEPAVREEKEVFAYAGERHVVVKGLDADGNTVSWTRTTEPVTGARLGAFADDGTVARIAVEGDVVGIILRWAFADFSGRILARGERPAEAEMTLDLPRKRLYTNYGGVRLELVRDDAVVDARGECVFETGNDRARLHSDFTPNMWPPSGTLESLPVEMRRLEEIGIRASLIPMGGADAFEFFLSFGMGVGSNWVGGDTFGGRMQKSNVRGVQFNTAEARKALAERAHRISTRMRKFGLLDYSLCDEPDLVRRGDSHEVDAHPENLAAYRERMRCKYGTIAEYNRRHETSYGDFAELKETLQADARRSGRFAEFIEWRNFNVDRWCEAIRICADGTGAVDPDVPFTMCNSFGQSALSGNDYWKLLTKANLGFSHEYTAMVYFSRSPIDNFDEFFRSFRPDMRMWGWTGYFYTSDRARFMPWWFAAHRYGGFSWYAANAWGYNLVDPTTFALTVDGKELKASLADSRLLDGLGKVLTCWPWAKHDTALYYSHESLLLATILGTETKYAEINRKGPLHDYMHSRMGAQYVVEDLLYQHDFVAPEQVAGGKLGGYRALLMPRINAMSDAEIVAVKAFLAKGGRVLADELPGAYDELGVKRTANPFEGIAGITVTGGNFDDTDRAFRAQVRDLLREIGATPALVCEGMVEHTGREAMHFVSGDADVYVVLRMLGRSTDDDALEFAFAKKGHVYDVRARTYLGETDRVTAKTPRTEAAVWAVLPAKVEGVAVSGLPSSAPRGTNLSLDFAIEQSSNRTIGQFPDYVLHIEFVAPSGACRFHMKRNILTDGGKAHLDFPMAFNDEPGEWTVRVTEPLTGVTAEKKFALNE